MELALRRRADGRLRLDLSQVDVRFASILLLPDHSLTALLPRDHAVARETASQVPAGGAFTPASLLLFLDQELVYGPVPPGVVTGVNPDDSRALRLLDPATGFIAQVELDADDLVTSKRLFASDGKERLRLVYDSAQWKDFSTVRRPTRCTATLADGSVFDVRLRRLRPVPAIADGGLQLDIPADAKTMSIDALAELLTVQPAEEKK